MSSDVQFDEMLRSVDVTYGESNSGLVGKVIDWSGGIIKTKKQAEVVLVFFIVVMTIFSFAFFFSVGDSDEYSVDKYPNIPAEY